jgi:hypothetical protein
MKNTLKYLSFSAASFVSFNRKSKEAPLSELLTK